MKAAFITQTGSPDTIHYGDLPEPEVGAGQVLMRVEAVSVNPIDTYVRSGAVKFELPQPYIVGCDAAGIVESVGDGVLEIQAGDRVWCTSQGLLGRQGTFAERIVVDADWCFPRSDGVGAADAAAAALVGITAHLGLFREAGHLFRRPDLAINAATHPSSTLAQPPVVLVIGGSGGVGSMVVQMAKIAGATVIATAGSDDKADRVRQLGADHVINYHRQSIQEEVARISPEGVDLFWETRREPDFDSAIAMLRERGMMILMAGREARPQFPVGPFYVKECKLSGFVMFKASATEVRIAAEDLDRWLATGEVRPNIGKTFPLSEAAQAHQLQEAMTLRGEAGPAGKIVLTV